LLQGDGADGGGRASQSELREFRAARLDGLPCGVVHRAALGNGLAARGAKNTTRPGPGSLEGPCPANQRVAEPVGPGLLMLNSGLRTRHRKASPTGGRGALLVEAMGPGQPLGSYRWRGLRRVWPGLGRCRRPDAACQGRGWPGARPQCRERLRAGDRPHMLPRSSWPYDMSVPADGGPPRAATPAENFDRGAWTTEQAVGIADGARVRGRVWPTLRRG